MGAPNHSRWERAPDSLSGEIVEFVIFLGGSLPIKNIGFIPDFPPPLFHLAGSIPLKTMLRPLVTEFTPFGVVARRKAKAQARVDHFFRGRVVGIILRMDGQRFRHEADLDEWPEVTLVPGVENSVQDGPIVNGFPGGIFGVNAG